MAIGTGLLSISIWICFSLYSLIDFSNIEEFGVEGLQILDHIRPFYKLN